MWSLGSTLDRRRYEEMKAEWAATSHIVPYHPFEVSAAGRSTHTLQELLQALAAILDPFRVPDAHVAVVPGLPPIAGPLFFASGVGQNEPVLPGVVIEPPGSARPREGRPELIARGRVREVHRCAELVLTVSRRGAQPAGVRPEDALQTPVGASLLLVRAVCRGHRQLLPVRRGVFGEAPQVLGRLAAERLATQGGYTEVPQRDEVFGHVIRGEGVRAVHQDAQIVAGSRRRSRLPRLILRRACRWCDWPDRRRYPFFRQARY